jgi:hypothetical protein
MSTTMTMNVYATVLSSCEDLYGGEPRGTPSVKLWFDDTFETTDPVFVKVSGDATGATAGELKFNGDSIPAKHVIVRLEDDGIISVKLAGLNKVVKNLAPGEYSGEVTVTLKTGGPIVVAVTATYELSGGAVRSKAAATPVTVKANAGRRSGRRLKGPASPQGRRSRKKSV